MTIIYFYFFFFNFSRQLFLRTNPPVNLTITSPHLSIVRCTYDRNTLPPLSLTVLFKMLKVIRRQENNKMCKLWIPLQSSLELSLSRWGLGARNKRPALVLALRFCLPLACGQLKMFFFNQQWDLTIRLLPWIKDFFPARKSKPNSCRLISLSVHWLLLYASGAKKIKPRCFDLFPAISIFYFFVQLLLSSDWSIGLFAFVSIGLFYNQLKIKQNYFYQICWLFNYERKLVQASLRHNLNGKCSSK